MDSIIKINNVTTNYFGVVFLRQTVELSSSSEEIKKLEDALQVLKLWNEETFKALNFDKNKVDWHMLDFEIKENNKVIVKFEAGACR